jgi:hypothetical protein
VSGALARAARPDAPLYLTVELADPAEVRAAYQAARRQGHPVVPGEDFDGVGYHHYPEREQVQRWLRDAGLQLLEQGIGDGYLHLLLRRPGAAAR